jgi:hypothetical protein
MKKLMMGVLGTAIDVFCKLISLSQEPGEIQLTEKRSEMLTFIKGGFLCERRSQSTGM